MPTGIVLEASASGSERDETAARGLELTTKRRGELSELAFTYAAATRGFGVSKPYGDSERYDFVLDTGRRLWRVQIKSTTTLMNGLYHVNSRRHTNGHVVAYHIDEVDFIVAHIIPDDSWYILPIDIVHARTSLLFVPNHRRLGCLLGPIPRAESRKTIACKNCSQRSHCSVCIKAAPKPTLEDGTGLFDAYREAWHLFRDGT